MRAAALRVEADAFVTRNADETPSRHVHTPLGHASAEMTSHRDLFRVTLTLAAGW
jgi:hypothetical protein